MTNNQRPAIGSVGVICFTMFVSAAHAQYRGQYDPYNGGPGSNYYDGGTPGLTGAPRLTAPGLGIQERGPDPYQPYSTPAPSTYDPYPSSSDTYMRNGMPGGGYNSGMDDDD